MADGLRFTKVISSSPSGLVVLAEDGNTYTITGDRSQRNNNPGAIAMSPVAAAHGAIGGDTIGNTTHLAIFPDMASGLAAQQELLFGSSPNHPQYRNLTLKDAIQKYAPAGVDGNPQPTSYYTKIANSLGVTTDTKLSDLTPAQQQQFMQVQAGIEGSRPQVIRDSQGNRVVLPPMNIPEVGSAYADTSPIPPLPVARSAAIAAINAATNAKRSNGNAGDTLAQNPITTADFGVSPGAPTITPQFDTLGLATGRDGTPYYSLPGAEPYGGYIPGFDGGSGILPSSVPLPRADPRLTPVSPLPRTALQTPVPATPLPAATQVASTPEAQTVSINGHPYTVGQIVTNPSNGLSYLVNANGTMTKQPHISLGTNTIAGGVAGQAVESAIQKAQAAAPAALASAGGALSGLLGNLFGKGNGATAASASAPSVPQSYGPAGGYYSPPQSIMPQATANGLDALAPVADRSEQLSQYNLANQPSYTTPTSYGGYIPGGTSPVPLASPNAITLPTPSPQPTTKTIINPAYTAWANNQTPTASPFTNPGVQGLSPDDRDSPNGIAQAVPGLTSSAFNTPAPQKYITVKVPAVQQPSPVMPLSPDPIELAALREQAMNPFQRFYASTPLGHITSMLGGGTSQSYGAPSSGGLLSMLSNGFAAPRPSLPVNNVANLISMGLAPSQAKVYASGGAAMQAANPNFAVASLTGALNPQVGSIAAPSSGSVISPFHSF